MVEIGNQATKGLKDLLSENWYYRASKKCEGWPTYYWHQSNFEAGQILRTKKDKYQSQSNQTGIQAQKTVETEIKVVDLNIICDGSVAQREPDWMPIVFSLQSIYGYICSGYIAETSNFQYIGLQVYMLTYNIFVCFIF